jgi:3-phenylpropionate/cinnamic acid dioxygenase small subunit
MDIQELSDRLEITDLLTRYARAVDRKDWNLYRTVFTADTHIDYTSAGGAALGLEEMCAWMDEALAQFPATQHLISNVHVEIDGDAATVEAMFHNPMKMPDGSAWVTGGWYHHDLVRTADGWRSRKLVEESAYFSGMPTDLSSPGGI